MVCRMVPEAARGRALPPARALRDAVIRIGWLKLASIVWYLGLHVALQARCGAAGGACAALKGALLAVVPPQLVTALLLFYAALEKRLVAVKVGVWLCAALALHHAVLGAAGTVVLLRTASAPLHFLLAFCFVLLALSVFTVLFHDILVLCAYKRSLEKQPARAAAAAQPRPARAAAALPRPSFFGE